MKTIDWDKLDIAVVIPCYNEELTIEKVITDFRQQLPAPKSLYLITTARTKVTSLHSRPALK